MENEVPIDPEKVKDIINFLSSYLLTLPSYNSIRVRVQEGVMRLYDIQSMSSITQEERDQYNDLLRQAEAPDYLMF